MDIKKQIKDAAKDEKLILGYNSVIDEIKTKKPKMVIYANNIPKDRLETIKHNCKVSGIDINEYPDNNKNLGLFCGKPFSVSVLAIKGSEK